MQQQADQQHPQLDSTISLDEVIGYILRILKKKTKLRKRTKKI